MSFVLRRILIAIALAIGPVAGGTAQQFSYALAPLACVSGRSSTLLAIAAVTCAACIGGLILSWYLWRKLDALDLPRRRSAVERFLVVLAGSLNAVFLIIVIALALPNFFIAPCT
ncbi:MAG TPA: hypothetical protein VHD34_01960 [Xanthobacteraceae bacterium]|nr:hypothetical protein [Xanthobacteraceae bacterium]